MPNHQFLAQSSWVKHRLTVGENQEMCARQEPQLEMCAEWETLEYSVLNRKSVPKSSPQSSEVHAEEEAGRWEGPEVEEHLKETASYLPGTTGWIHIWTQRRGQHTLLHRLKTRQKPSTQEGKYTQTAVPNQEATHSWCLLGIGKFIFSNGVILGTLISFQGGPLPRSSWPAQTDPMFLCAFFFSSGFILLLVVLMRFCFNFIFCFLLEGEGTERERGQEGGEHWETRERREILCKNKLITLHKEDTLHST